MDTKTPASHFPEPRAGDYGLGIPTSRIEGARNLSDDEIEEGRRRENDELRKEFENSLRQLEAAKSNFVLPDVARRALTWGGCVLVSVLGLLLVSQAAVVVSAIRSLPVPLDWIFATLAVLFAGLLGWMILQLVLMLVRLQRSPSVNLQAIRTLQERRRMQLLATEHAKEAERELRIYLQRYQFDDETRRRLVVLGLTRHDCDDLGEAKKYLLADDNPMPPEEWLSEFRRRFQSILDRAGENRVKRYAMKVGTGTALSPVAMIDKAIVLYVCVALIKDLVFLYGLRPAFGQSATILANSILQIYLGGLMQETLEATADTISSELNEDLEVLATQVPAIFSKLGAKVAEGATNGLLVWRLGKQTISFLQPVVPSK